MTVIHKNRKQQPLSDGKKILLLLLPFWDPQVPPLGISCLKSFLQPHGYRVKTVDANIEVKFRKIYNRYFDILKEYIPAGKRRHLYNIGHDVLRNHAMAHQHPDNQDEYVQLVKMLVYNTFYHQIDDAAVLQLNRTLEHYYLDLETYLLNLLERETPGVLGLSVYSGTLPASLFAFKLVKEKHPHIETVMGGGIFSGELSPDSDNFKGFIEKTPYIDKIIVGEGETLFHRYLKNQLPGPAKVVKSENRENRLLDLDNVEVPDFSDFDTGYYVQMANYSSRSCPFQCSFCVETVYWGKYRKKSANRLAAEMIRLYEKYGRQLFFMCDSLLNPVIDDLAREFIDREIALYWGGYLRASQAVSLQETTMLWRRGGFYRARLGLESGSPKILESMGKKITLEQMKNSVVSLAHAGIKTTTYWVIGYPGETEADFQMTLDLITELKDDIYEADCNPFWYFKGGQVKSDQWQQQEKSVPLYPGKFLDMLLLQTWVLKAEPNRQEMYDRVNRFIEHCQRSGIPNPYSLDAIKAADQRWKNLHKNAVPALMEFQDKNNYISECKDIKDMVMAKNTQQYSEEWAF